MPLAVFRCDASLAIGGGHAMRCLTLAGVLRDLGWTCGFATSAETPATVPSLAASEFDVANAAGMLSHWPAADLLVVDHYGLDASFERAARPWARRILVIDDLADRPHEADLLLDQTHGRVQADYGGRYNGPMLLGAGYALLRPSFQRARGAAIARRDRRPVDRIMVSFGAVDAVNATMVALDAIALAAPDCAVDVVLGSAGPHLVEVRARAAAMPRATVHVDVAEIAELMTEADLAIGAPGTSAWERCCLGLPTLLLTIADNQRVNAAALHAAGAALDLGWHADSNAKKLATEIGKLGTEAWQAMTRKAAALCDGRGAFRVALGLLVGRTARDGGKVTLRAASENDGAIMLEWQRDPETRRFARKPTAPTATEHFAWLACKLADPDCLFAIVEHGGEPAGILRLDRRAGPALAYEVSIVTAPGKRGLGLAPAALALGRELAPGADLVAEVLPANTASLALFERAGYKRGTDGLFHARPTVH